PEDQAEELRGIFEVFDERSTREARFARTMENFQPILLNDSNGGSDWREHGVCLSQVLGRHKRNGEGSQVIGDYILDLIGDNVRKGNIKDR
ncbi:MAG: HD domain-containing protein, partial [Lachnospiraceae bacterium]|nr:HD domain-containing protein [Lachnospiraceae bacterium]